LIMEFDSNEEKYFSWYLDELKEAGFVEKYEAQPESYVLAEPVSYSYNKYLKTKVKHIGKALIQKHIYTADFKIYWAYKARGIFFYNILDEKDLTKIPFVTVHSNYTLIEIKPCFDRNNMTRLFTINQKWLYKEHSIYAEKIIVDKKNGKGLFPDTFTPAGYLLTDKTNKPRKLKYEPRSLNQYLALKGGQFVDMFK